MDVSTRHDNHTAGLPETGWRKASYCGSDGGNCVEINSATGIVGVRDTKRPGGRPLVFPATRWQRFLAAAHDGRFDS